MQCVNLLLSFVVASLYQPVCFYTSICSGAVLARWIN